MTCMNWLPNSYKEIRLEPKLQHHEIHGVPEQKPSIPKVREWRMHAEFQAQIRWQACRWCEGRMHPNMTHRLVRMDSFDSHTHTPSLPWMLHSLPSHPSSTSPASTPLLTHPSHSSLQTNSGSTDTSPLGCICVLVHSSHLHEWSHHWKYHQVAATSSQCPKPACPPALLLLPHPLLHCNHCTHCYYSHSWPLSFARTVKAVTASDVPFCSYTDSQPRNFCVSCLFLFCKFLPTQDLKLPLFHLQPHNIYIMKPSNLNALFCISRSLTSNICFPITTSSTTVGFSHCSTNTSSYFISLFLTPHTRHLKVQLKVFLVIPSTPPFQKAWAPHT